MKEQILELRKLGYSYKKIVAELGCSKGTVSYHCSKGGKQRNLERHRKLKSNNKLIKRIEKFHKGLPRTFTWQDLVKKCGENTVCYLSGGSINVMTGDDYNLDHIIPFSKSGQPTLENCGVTKKCYNVIKHNLLLEDLIKISINILLYNNKIITKDGLEIHKQLIKLDQSTLDNIDSVDVSKYNRRIKSKVYKFNNRTKGNGNNTQGIVHFTLEQFLDKFKDKHFCYLTGEPIIINNHYTYSLDHIIPKHLNGDNTLENCGLLLPIVNQMKNKFTVDEFLMMLETILKYRGYTIN